MKRIILIFLILTSVILPQAKKSVLTDAQKDSIQAMIDSGNFVDKTSTQDITGQKTFSNNKTVFGTTTNDSVSVTGRLQANRLGVGGKPVSTGLSIFDANFRMSRTTTLPIMNTLSNNNWNGGSITWGLEGSTGGQFANQTTPYSFVVNNVAGYPIEFLSAGQILLKLKNDTAAVYPSVLWLAQNNPTIKGDTVNLVGVFKLNGNTLAANGSVGNADSLGGVPASGYKLNSELNSWSSGITPSSDVMRLGKTYADRRFNNGAYSDNWIIDYVVPPYNLSANWLYPIEHRTDYYNDTLNTVAHSDILNIDGTGTPIWRTNDVRIMGNEIAVNVGDLPDSTALDWSLAGLTGNKVILSEANKTAVTSRFPMPVYGYQFKFGSTPYYTYPYVYGFYSDLTTNTPSLETAYHFYGKGDFPSYFGGDMQIIGDMIDSIKVTNGTAKVLISPNDNYGLQISRPNDDVGIKIKVNDQKTGWIAFTNEDGVDIGEIEFDTDGTTKTFEIGTNTDYDVILRSNTNNTVVVSDTNVVIDGYVAADSGVFAGSKVMTKADSTLYFTQTDGQSKLDANFYSTIDEKSVPAGIDKIIIVDGSTYKYTNVEDLLALVETNVDSNAVRDLALAEITTKLDTMASDTSTHTMAEIDKAVDNTLYSVIKLNPESSTTFTLLRTKAETIVDSVFCLVQGASASVDFNIAYGTNRTSGTDIFGTDQTADNVTVGETFSTFSSATIPVNNMIWLDITTATNTPTEFLCVIYYH